MRDYNKLNGLHEINCIVHAQEIKELVEEKIKQAYDVGYEDGIRERMTRGVINSEKVKECLEERIQVGDEITANFPDGLHKIVVTKIKGDYYYGLDETGVAYAINRRDKTVSKTGRKCVIQFCEIKGRTK